MPSLKRLKKGYRIKFRDGEKQRYLYVEGSRGQAEAEVQRIGREVAAGKPLRRLALLSLDEVLIRWERSRLAGKRPNDAHSTAKAVRVAKRYFGIMGWKTTADITPAEVQRMREALPRSARAGANIRAIIWWAKDYAEQPVEERTLVGLRPPPDEGRPPRDLPPTANVLAAIESAKAMSENAGWLVHCLATYGWRAITAARARCGDLRADGIVVRTKGRRGHREQLVPLLPVTLAGLRSLATGHRPEAPLFLDPRTGKAWPEHDAGSIPHWTRHALKIRANDIKFHAVTTLLDVLEPHQARDLTTHKTLSQLYRYARGNRERGQKTIAKLLGNVTKGDQPSGTVGDKTVDDSSKVPVKET